MKKISRLLSVFSVMLIVLAACKHGKNEHLSQKTMEKILMDMHVAEAYSTVAKDSLHKAGMKNYDSLGVWYTTIFQHYKITGQQFNESLDWYKNHPAEIDSLYADLIPIVTKMQSKAMEHTPN